MCSRFVYIVTYISNSFFYCCQIMLHLMARPHFVYPFINWQKSGCFHFGAITNDAAMNVCIQVFVWTCGSLLLVMYLGVRLLGHMKTLYFTLLETNKLFLGVVTPFCIPTNNVCVFQFLHINTCYCLSLMTPIFVNVKYYFIMVFICISLVTNNVQLLLLCVLVTYMSFSQKWLFKPFAHF